MSNIHVGAKVKVISGGRYLGKEGTISHVGPKTALVSGHFPRSLNKSCQEFPLECLKATGASVKKRLIKETD